MRRLPALVAALLLPAASPLVLGTAAFTGALLASQAPAQAQSAEAVAKAAQSITVRIEGATQGSGVLVKREGNRYTVLTAWHVVSDQTAGEELDIFVHDGSRQQLEQGSIKRLGEVDLAVLTFTSTNSYEVAQVGDIKSVSMGNPIWVSGFPLPSSAIPIRLMRFIKGDVIANATVAIPDGYQLLYDNQTLPGVSGGAVLNAQGQLVGIHGRAEKADQVSERSGKAIATGTNQGVPISFYSQYSSGAAVFASSTQAVTADDFLAQAQSIAVNGLAMADQKNVESFARITELTSKAIALSPGSSVAYAWRARAYVASRDYQLAIQDADKSLSISGANWMALYARAKARDALGDMKGAIEDYSRALDYNPLGFEIFNNRGSSRLGVGDNAGALEDFNRSLAIKYTPTSLAGRGIAMYRLGSRREGCESIRMSASLGFSVAQRLLEQKCK